MTIFVNRTVPENYDVKNSESTDETLDSVLGSPTRFLRESVRVVDSLQVNESFINAIN